MGEIKLEERKYTIEEYFALVEEEAGKYEYFHGNIFALAGGSINHLRIQRNCIVLLDTMLKGTDCEVLFETMRLEIHPKEVHFYPDLMIHCDKDRLDKYAVKFPSLIIEVLSNSTEAKDRKEKFEAYLKIPTLKNYLLISQNEVKIEIFGARENGKGWTYDRFESIEDSISLPALNLNLKVSEIYADIMFDN